MNKFSWAKRQLLKCSFEFIFVLILRFQSAWLTISHWSRMESSWILYKVRLVCPICKEVQLTRYSGNRDLFYHPKCIKCDVFPLAVRFVSQKAIDIHFLLLFRSLSENSTVAFIFFFQEPVVKQELPET